MHHIVTKDLSDIYSSANLGVVVIDYICPLIVTRPYELVSAEVKGCRDPMAL
jgi:hypothetical protein